MKKTILILSISSAMLLSACSKTETNSNAGNGAKNTATATKTEAPVPSEPQVSVAKAPGAGTSSPADTGEAIKFAFGDFPAAETTAKAGEYVLVPSYNWLQEALTKPETTFIFYQQRMAAPDKENSEIQFMSERKKVPNAYIVAIPPGQKAKNGDVVLTWWQTGSGMNRAIVVDDKDPISPVVRYLDIDYDNPAQSRDKSTTIGKMDEKIVPDSFVKLSKPFESGTAVAVQDGANQKLGIVINVAGDKVFVKMFAGKMKVVAKKDCTPLPIVPDVKEGDRVKAEWVGSLNPGTVTKVDAKIGRVFVKFDVDGKEKAVAFGNLMK